MKQFSLHCVLAHFLATNMSAVQLLWHDNKLSDCFGKKNMTYSMFNSQPVANVKYTYRFICVSCLLFIQVKLVSNLHKMQYNFGFFLLFPLDIDVQTAVYNILATLYSSCQINGSNKLFRSRAKCILYIRIQDCNHIPDQTNNKYMHM